MRNKIGAYIGDICALRNFHLSVKRFALRSRRHMWVAFVGSLLCTARFFSGYSGFFFSPQKLIFDFS